MMITAASDLGNFQDGRGNNNENAAKLALLPPNENMRDVAIHIAIGFALQAQKDGVAPEMSKRQISDHIQKNFLDSRISQLQIAKKQVFESENQSTLAVWLGWS